MSLQAMLAARALQDAKWQAEWSAGIATTATGIDVSSSAAVLTATESTEHVDDNSGFYFEGHYYRYPNEHRIHQFFDDVTNKIKERESLDALWAAQRPVEPNPPSPRSDAGAGSSSTMMTSDQGTKSDAAS
jgi:hypothetical protein